MNPLCRIIRWRTMFVCLAVLLYSCDRQSPATPSTSEPVSGPFVNAPAGQLEGQIEGALHVYKGIPYAEPPVGPARWTPPTPMPPWSGIRQAIQYGPSCIQPTRTVASIYAEDLGPFSEDCLTLNVWAQAGASNAPVLVWFHGGALTYGSSSMKTYDGARMAKEGIILVSANFRIGIFGHLAHPELSAESPMGVSGNYGLLDQVEVLRWVNKNISSFGGDPSNVAIFGESSGALGVMHLMATPGARGLFSRAITQSAYMISSPELKQSRFGYPTAEAIGSGLLEKLEIPDIAALRAHDAQALADAAAGALYFPEGTIDGHVLPRQIIEVFDRGEQAPVPILAGFTSGEIRSMRVLAPPAPDRADIYESTIKERYGGLADEFLRLYPSDTLEESVLATTRDALYGWTAERLVRRQTELGYPSFLFLFDHGYPATDEAGLHAFHASELPFVFGNLKATPPLWPKIPDTPLEINLSDAMVGYWTSFAATGLPSANAAPDWPAYGSTRVYMRFAETPQPSEHLMPGMFELHEQTVCLRWASELYPWHWNTGIISPPIPVDEEGRCARESLW